MQRILLGFVAFLFLLLLWVGFNSFDQDGFDDLGLLGQIEYPKDEDNGYTLIAGFIEEHGELVDKVDDEIFQQHYKREDHDQDYVDGLVKANQAAYAILEQVLKKPSFAFPKQQDVYDLPDYTSFVDMSRFLLLKSAGHFFRFEMNKAAKDLGLVIKISRLLMNEQGHTLIAFMIGQSLLLDSISYADEFSYFLKGNASEFKEVKQLLADAPSFEDNYFSNSFVGEYHFALNILNLYFDKSLSERLSMYKENHTDNAFVDFGLLHDVHTWLFHVYPYYFIHINKSMETYALAIKAAQEKAGRSCGVYLEKERDWFVSSIGWKNFMPNGMDNTLNSGEYSDLFNEYFPRNCHVQTYKGAVIAKYALLAFYGEYGRFPESLNQLTPEFLSTVPTDYFGGAELLYNKESNTKVWLYSLGQNLIDGGGSEDSLYIKKCHEDESCRINPTYLIDINEPSD